MAVILVCIIGICVCMSLSLALINCLSCRRKETEEELQQKYFEKFRKKHMKARDRVLTNRVDVVRPRTDSQISGVSCEADHTYQSIGSFCHPHTPKSDAGTTDDHSFFDESFQTVVEASSYNMTDITDCKTELNCLSVSTNLASYISFQQQRLNSTSFPIVEQSDKQSSGEVNLAFNGDSVRGGQISQNSLSDDYIIPNHGPKIRVTEHDVRKSPDEKKIYNDLDPSCPKGNVCNDLDIPPKHHRLNSDLTRKVNNLDTKKHLQNNLGICNKARNQESIGDQAEGKSDRNSVLVNSSRLADCTKVKSVCQECQSVGYQCQRCEAMCSACQDGECADAMCQTQYKQKLRVEGKSHFSRSIGRNQHEKKSKGRTKLVIPGLAMDSHNSSSDHTYDSIVSMTEGTVTRDSVEIVAEHSLSSDRRKSSSDGDHTYESIMSKSCEDLISSMAKSNVSDSSPGIVNAGYVGQECTPNISKRSASDSDTAVVIIGRRVSQRYRPMLPSGNNDSDIRMWNSRLELQDKLANTYKSPHKSRRDSLERYSPFPSSTKKLAFKPTFKQAASPRFPSMRLKSGNLRPTFLTELLNSASKNIGIENFNIDTPEMKVKDSPKVFTIDTNVFISPKEYMLMNGQSQALLNKDQPMSLPQTFLSTPVGGMCTKESGPIRKSLPSLPDDLELVLESHCSEGVNAMSTPTV